MPSLCDRIKIRGQEIRQKIEDDKLDKLQKLVLPIYDQILKDIRNPNNFQYKYGRMIYEYKVSHCLATKYMNISGNPRNFSFTQIHGINEFSTEITNLGFRFSMTICTLFEMCGYRFSPYIIIEVYRQTSIF
jgi:hypothetical protein